LIVEAESVFARLASCEDKVALSLLLSIHDDLLVGAHNLVIDVERSSCLDLQSRPVSIYNRQKDPMELRAYSEVERNLRALILDRREETCLLVSGQLVCEGCRRHERGEAG
jgi:hypothetical protein